MNGCRCVLLVLMLGLILPTVGRAQQNIETGSIQGTVTDTSGAAVSGVAVEVSSPALIKNSAATTDERGAYKIVALPPGAYSVTFRANNFQQLQRTGIQLTSGFTATVDAMLTVGSVTQTVEVQEAAPVLDTKDATVQQTLEGSVVRELPISKNSGEYAMVLPGAVYQSLSYIDIGGTQGEVSAPYGIHGSNPYDKLTLTDGQYNHTMLGPIGGQGISSVNPATIQEVNLQLPGGLTAEAISDGIQQNTILRDGGNQFHGTFQTDFKVAQGNNITAALIARGATFSQKIKINRDFAGGVGGPIIRNKLWFFADGRDWTSYSYVPGIYYNALENTPTGNSGFPLLYQSNPSKPGYFGTFSKSGGIRLTWQASSKNRFSALYHYEYSCEPCFSGLGAGTLAPEAAYSWRVHPYELMQVRWTHPFSEKLLFEAGLFGTFGSSPLYPGGGTSNNISVLNLSTNFRYGSPTSLAHYDILQWNTAGDLSYLTHSHAFKFGYLYLHAGENIQQGINQDVAYTFLGTVPQSITYYAYPQLLALRENQSALFAEDQWTIGKKLTVSPGLRLVHVNGHVPATTDAAGPYVPSRSFPAAHDIPNWYDLNPILGGAYDLFSNHKTVIRGDIGRFDSYEGLSLTVEGADPANTQVTTATRTWNDANKDYIPQASELGPLSNTNFGLPVTVTQYDPDLIHGFDKRPYAWEASVAVQHELRPGLAVNVGYFRTWYGNFQVTKNLDVTPADYQSFCINEPSNSLLPSGGGQQICGLEDLNTALVPFGKVNNLVTRASRYGKETEIYNGLDFTINWRFGKGGLLTGGVSTSQTTTNSCAVDAAVPEAGGVTTIGSTAIGTATADPTQFCHVTPPWSAETQFKLSGVYPLPWWGIQISGVFNDLPSFPVTALYNATCTSNPEICQQLGRSLAAGKNAVAAVQLIPPNSDFRSGFISFLNLTIAKNFALRSLNMQPQLGLYNILNQNGIEQVVTTYGPSWQNINGVLPPRLLKIGLRVDW